MPKSRGYRPTARELGQLLALRENLPAAIEMILTSSYPEDVARYVMPRFQHSVARLQASERWSASVQAPLDAAQAQALKDWTAHSEMNAKLAGPLIEAELSGEGRG